MELSIPANASPHCSAIKLVIQYCKSSIKVQDGQPSLSMKTPEGVLTGINTICKVIASSSSPSLLGDTPEQTAQVDQWLNFVHTQLTPIADNKLEDLNSWLATRTFFVGHAITLADLVLYAHLSAAIPKFPIAQQSVFCHLLRWYDYVHHTADTAALFPPVSLPAPSVPSLDSVRAAISAAESRAAASKAESAAKGGAGGNSKAGKGAGDGATSKAKPEAPTPAAGGDKKKGGKGDKGGAAADGGAKKGAEPAAAAGDGPRIDQLDIRVGTIVAVQKHPNAEALYLEEIDVGEDKPRQVISGLVKFVPEERMRGLRVAVVCNLKPAKMRDVMSYGMVLCASNDAHDAVDPLVIPEGVPNGERIVCEGYENDADAQINPKKKVLEKLSVDMKTNAEGVACFQGIPFSTSKGAVTATIPNAWVK